MIKLGLDIGTNSIGWALIQQNFEEKKGEIIDLGTRIIPMSQEILGDFDKGNSISQTAERTSYRGIRRLRERQLLRRERLHRVLNILEFLPKHYAQEIDFEKHLGQFIGEAEPKLVYKLNDETKQYEFIFKKAFEEMVADFATYQPELVADGKKVPYDWAIYYLRKKALLESYHKDPLKFFQHYYSSKFIFWKFIYTKDFKTVGEAENYLLEKSKKSKLLAYVFNRFMEYIGEIAYTSSSSFTDFRLKIWNDAQNSMQLTATYTELSKYIRLTDPAKLSDKESYVPRFSYSRNFIWKDKKMIPIAVNYEKKSFFMLPNDPKTYSSLAEVGVRVDDLYHKDSFSIIMPS
jgi:hypothetical protein